MAAVPAQKPNPERTASPGPLTSDFARQQVLKQQKNNFHSSSLKTMSVNQTNLHPHGVQYVISFYPWDLWGLPVVKIVKWLADPQLLVDRLGNTPNSKRNSMK